jgi:hypothetical protein
MTFSSSTKPKRQYEITMKDITGTSTKSKAKQNRNEYQIEIKLGSWKTLDHETRDLGRSQRGFHLGGVNREMNNNDGEEADLLRLDEEEADRTEEEADRTDSTPPAVTEPDRRSS